jgi:hypothetical protein
LKSVLFFYSGSAERIVAATERGSSAPAMAARRVFGSAAATTAFPPSPTRGEGENPYTNPKSALAAISHQRTGAMVPQLA